MKAQQLVQQLKAAGKPIKEGMFFVAGYDPVRRSSMFWVRGSAWGCGRGRGQAQGQVSIMVIARVWFRAMARV